MTIITLQEIIDKYDWLTKGNIFQSKLFGNYDLNRKFRAPVCQLDEVDLELLYRTIKYWDITDDLPDNILHQQMAHFIFQSIKTHNKE